MLDASAVAAPGIRLPAMQLQPGRAAAVFVPREARGRLGQMSYSAPAHPTADRPAIRTRWLPRPGRMGAVWAALYGRDVAGWLRCYAHLAGAEAERFARVGRLDLRQPFASLSWDPRTVLGASLLLPEPAGGAIVCNLLSNGPDAVEAVLAVSAAYLATQYVLVLLAAEVHSRFDGTGMPSGFASRVAGPLG